MRSLDIFGLQCPVLNSHCLDISGQMTTTYELSQALKIKRINYVRLRRENKTIVVLRLLTITFIDIFTCGLKDSLIPHS